MSQTTTPCGCCTGLAPITPQTNPPGLPALNYRLAAYSSFFARMRAQLASPTLLASPPPTGDWAIASLTTRSPDDPAIALLDAWAVVLDVLTFYQERVANEGYLRTALERRSVLELARAIGYELSPGVAASTYLSFIIEDVIGTPSTAPLPQSPKTPSAPTQGAATYNAGIVTLPTGTQVQSIPPQGSLPQTFETSVPLSARTDWNLMLPRLTRPADYAITASGQLAMIDIRAAFAANSGSPITGNNCYLLNPDTPALAPTQTVYAVPADHFLLSGVTTGIQPGDLLALIGINSQNQLLPLIQTVLAVTPLPASGQTRIDFSTTPQDLTFAPQTFPAASIPGAAQPFNQSTVEAWVLTQSIDESDLQALIKISNWDPELLASVANSYSTAPGAGLQGIYTFNSEASCFGHNAPPWLTLPRPNIATRGDAYPSNWDLSNNNLGPTIGVDSQSRVYQDATLYLERNFTVLPGTLALLEPQGASQPGALRTCQVTQVSDKSLADYGMSTKSTGLTLAPLDARPWLALNQPAAAIFGAANELLAFAAAPDGNIYQLAKAPGEPTNTFNQRLPGNFANTPVILTTGPNPLQLFAVDRTLALYTTWTTTPNDLNNSWTTPIQLPGAYLFTPSVVAPAVKGAAGRNALDLFGIGTDSQLYHLWSTDGVNWAGPEYRGGSPSILGAPCAVEGGPSMLEVFYICSDGQLYHSGVPNTPAGTPWTWWGPAKLLPTPQPALINSPSVSLQGTAGRTGENLIDIFAHGADGHLYHTRFNPDTPAGTAYWHNLEDLGIPFNLQSEANVPFQGSPCLVDDGPSPLEIFSIGVDGNLYHKWWANYWWGPYNLGGGNLVGSPSATKVGTSRLEVLASGSDGLTYRFYLDSTGWHGPAPLATGPYYSRSTKIHFASQQQSLAELPITDTLAAASTSLMLNGLIVGLTPGQAVAITGSRSDAPGVTASEVVLLSDIVHIGGFTQLELDPPGLTYSYLRNSVTLNANTVQATHGVSIAVSEVLGSGDATQSNQSFTLKRTPLTYVSAPTANGVQSTLTLRVNDLLWTEQPSLYNLGPSDRSYITRLADDGTVTVTFGDGVTGARLPSGQNNVIAQYRTGIGSAGNVAASSLSILQSRPPGLRSVGNVLAATGGADPQDLNGARSNAPLTVLTLDRIVSVTDYEDFAAAFAGIGKAQALLLPLQSFNQQLIHLTIAGVQGALVPATSDLFLSLTSAIDQARDPLPLVHIGNYQPALFNITASLILDTPTYVAADLLTSATAAILAWFAFDQRAFAQSVTASEVIATLQAVPGIIAVELTELYRTDQTAQGLLQPVLLARTAGLPPNAVQTSAASIFAQILPAELLLLNPIGLSLTEK